MSEISESENKLKGLRKELGKLEAAQEYRFDVIMTDEIKSLVTQGKDITIKLSENQKILESEMNSIFCPVCQEGKLNTTVRGKILGLIPDKWLRCSKCNAEFDKKLDKAALVKVTKDPYGIFRKYANQTISLEKWNEIGLTRIKREISDYEKQLSGIKSKLGDFLLQQSLEGKLKLIFVDLSSFLLKKDEIPLFATIAEVIEERKKRVTQRTTIGSVRSYGGFSFRIVKGLYGHLGASAPVSPSVTTIQSTEYTELITADAGDFLVTNQRLLFKGERSRGLAIPLKQIIAINIDPEEKALLIIPENKKPSILKLRTPDTVCLGGIEVPFSINLEHIVEIIKMGGAGLNKRVKESS